ncbi:hypothetical protein GAR05_03442 [Micromonospora saelicesensis]|uniref:GAF domain-containing protein n=1 Tax=Micromonospora saelicesensis TaxID=285676 RepID=A0ABX9CHS6_9ACTN|nr:GAF domain-containing protein [Micromonospora saelicesensis]RAN97916.1 hypothetical protein GAR05_03442 [Micromonospora saelicesensis]
MTITRWVGLLLLPAAVVLLTRLAAVKEGQSRTLSVIGLILVVLLLAFLQVYGEIQKWLAERLAVTARVALAGALNRSGSPLVTLLGRVAEAEKGPDRRAEVWSLATKTVGIAHTTCGRLSGRKAGIRCVFYQFESPDRLVRVFEEGRQGPPARLDFVRTRNENDRQVIERALGEKKYLVADVDKAPPKDFASSPDREYKSMLMVPVRTESRSYGFLSVDADKIDALTQDDVGHVALMAGLLAASMALLGEDYPQLRRSNGGATNPAQGGNPVPAQHVNESDAYQEGKRHED